jgi:AraC-like DNA-binding protein
MPIATQFADAAGTSRSVFADRFNRIVGMPPIDYLKHWRMALAKDTLRSEDGRLAEIASACGYQSARAFSAAFSRVVGCSPARYATGRRSPPPQPVASPAVVDRRPARLRDPRALSR